MVNLYFVFQPVKKMDKYSRQITIPLRDKKGRFIRKSTLLNVLIDHGYSEEPLGVMTVSEFKKLSKDGGNFITSLVQQ